MITAERLTEQVEHALSALPKDLPYPRFSIDNVLPEFEYAQLLREFPLNLCTSGVDERNFAGYTVDVDHISDSSLSPAWKVFVASLSSQETLEKLVATCSEAATLRYPKWMRPFVRGRLSNPQNYWINVAFNISHGGRYLPPHSDNSYKVLALVHYFTDESEENAASGTIFYRPLTQKATRNAVHRFNRLSDSRIVYRTPLCMLPMTSCNIQNNSVTEIDRAKAELWFHGHFENDFTIPFVRNRIAGFIKTQSSFHAVDLRAIDTARPRQTLLINLNLKHSRIARLGQFLRVRVLQLSS